MMNPRQVCRTAAIGESHGAAIIGKSQRLRLAGTKKPAGTNLGGLLN
jgi:hypothetical protein